MWSDVVWLIWLYLLLNEFTNGFDLGQCAVCLDLVGLLGASF